MTFPKLSPATARILPLLEVGAVPFVVLTLSILALVIHLPILYIIAAGLGIATITYDSLREIRAGRYSLDYIALLAMIVGIVAHEYAAGAIVALMFTGGKALEAFANGRAESSLRALLDRIPKSVLVRQSDGSTREVALTDAKHGDVIVVRANELVPLDGILQSLTGTFDEANLTGEAIPISLTHGAAIKSGVVNVGTTIDLQVTGTFETSTYARIVELVKTAKIDEAPLVRVAGKANGFFTITTLIIAGLTFWITRDPSRLLAVLVLATPCPLIIAAPVAFIGGMSRGASKNIIVKKPGLLETVARATVVFFDKTGTLTLGEPTLTGVKLAEAGGDHTLGGCGQESAPGGDPSENDLLQIAASIEFHSIHPLARAFGAAAKARGITLIPAEHVAETIGHGISGSINGTTYTVAQAPHTKDSSGIELLLSRQAPAVHGANESGIHETDKDDVGIPLATFSFADVLKPEAVAVLKRMHDSGLHIEVITGDTQTNAEAVFGTLPLTINADCSPEDKYRIIDDAKSKGSIVVMVGDGLNDAPALARAHAGIVFSGTENSAAIEAADAVILGSDIAKVAELFEISKRSLGIAQESIWVGIGLSIVGMTIAAFGFIPPVVGAFIQEGIDVSVILNSLRAIRGSR